MSETKPGAWGSVIGFLAREGTALVYAALIWFVIWGGYDPAMDTPEAAFGQALLIAMLSLSYLGVQALAVVSAPLARETRYLLDLMLSLVPLALVGYAAVQVVTGQMTVTLLQSGVLWLAGLTCAIDVVVFTWFNMKLNKLASDFVPMR
ncbi:MAG: hypothetical protein ACFCUN_13030 [Hyphomicrobiaceae bacterium]